MDLINWNFCIFLYCKLFKGSLGYWMNFWKWNLYVWLRFSMRVIYYEIFVNDKTKVKYKLTLFSHYSLPNSWFIKMKKTWITAIEKIFESHNLRTLRISWIDLKTPGKSDISKQLVLAPKWTDIFQKLR